MRGYGALFATLTCLLLYTGQTLALCPTNYLAVGKGCFHFFNDKVVDYSQAIDLCESLEGELAILEDCQLFSDVVDYIYSHDYEVEEGYWIGGTDILIEGDWKWTHGGSMLMGAPFWGRAAEMPAEPNGGEAENCASMDSGDGFFINDNNCEDFAGLAPLCQTVTDAIGMCPAPYILLGKSCFQFLPLEATWSDSRTICQASAGDLAVLDDCQLYSEVVQYITQYVTIPHKGFWIGGSDDAVEGEWVWVTGGDMPSGVPFWGQAGSGPLQPDDTTGTHDCAELWAKDRYYFNDVGCIAERSPLCQAPRL